MNRIHYDVFLGGRLLRETPLIWTPPFGLDPARQPADDEFVPGHPQWRVDGQPIAEDIAAAMLTRPDTSPGSEPADGPPQITRHLARLLLATLDPQLCDAHHAAAVLAGQLGYVKDQTTVTMLANQLTAVLAATPGIGDPR